MTIIIAFTAASFVASALVVSACAMSSRVSQREGVEEFYAARDESTPAVTKPVAPFSVN